MITLHPSILEKEGKKEFAILPFEEFLQIQELLQDFDDLKDLRKAKYEEGNSLSFSLSEVKKKLDL